MDGRCHYQKECTSTRVTCKEQIDQKATLSSLCYTFIYTVITYCNLAWGRAPTIYCSIIRILQKRNIRIISIVEFAIIHTLFSLAPSDH